MKRKDINSLESLHWATKYVRNRLVVQAGWILMMLCFLLSRSVAVLLKGILGPLRVSLALLPTGRSINLPTLHLLEIIDVLVLTAPQCDLQCESYFTDLLICPVTDVLLL